MKAKSALIASIGSLGIVGSANADIASAVINGAIPNAGLGLGASSTIVLPAVSSINSITIVVSHTFGGDLDMFVDTPTTGLYNHDLMFNETGNPGATGDFDLGLVGGDGSLANAAAYTFTTAGTNNWVAPFSPSGTYNANGWTAGPQAGGNYTLRYRDDTTNNDNGSIVSWSIDYTPVPGPASLALLGIAGMIGSRRRRR